MRILIVEDNINLVRSLTDVLTQQSHSVDTTDNAEDAVYYTTQSVYDVIIMDVMLKASSGYDAVRGIRKAGISTPILMLTAKSEILDKIHGLDSGADDYMTKPFSPEELLARLRALSRRKSEIVMNKLTFQDLELELSSNRLICGEKELNLNFKESQIMKLLIENTGQIISKEQIILKVWDYDSDVERNNVEVYISFLRKKLRYLNSKTVIVTLRKLGYRLEAADDCAEA